MAWLEDFYIRKVSFFLKTVVCFDDQAGFECSIDNQVKVAQAAKDGFEEEVEKQEISPAPESKVEEPQEEPSCLDAKALTDAFAESAILCSVMKPRGEAPDIERQVVTLAGAADVIILDWILAGKDPTITRDAIIRILNEDKDKGGRLRLIVVYSIQRGGDIITQLLEAVGPLGFSKKNENVLQMQDGHSLIVVFQKPGTPTSDIPTVNYDELPRKVIESFTTLTSGLLPAAIVSAIAVIRDRTHHLLATFPAALDAAFLTHRCLIPDPNDAELFLLDLLESEIGSLLRQSSSVSECVNSETCEKWIKSKGALTGAKRDGLVTAVTTYSRNKKLDKIKNGFDLDKEKTSDRQIATEVITLLCQANQCDMKDSKESLSILATIEQPRKHSPIKLTGIPPKLRLGVVVKDKDSNYLMCIQPLCDSVRISNNKDTDFPFLLLQQANPNPDKSSWDLCVPSDGSVIWFEISPFPRNIISFSFRSKSATEGYVEASANEKSFAFHAQNGVDLEWVAELKIGKAQRIVSQLAARIHTLGIDEFEWMRLHQTRQ